MEKCMAIEKKHVHQVYNKLAKSLGDASNSKPWPAVVHFLNSLEYGSLVADVGCGHGKYLNKNPFIYITGSDRCSPLLLLARRQGADVALADTLQLPYRSNSFDAVISIGVIHHLTSVERRIKALNEIARILRPGGKVLLYVWAMEQRVRRFEAQDVLIPYRNPSYNNSSQTSSTSDEDRLEQQKLNQIRLIKQQEHQHPRLKMTLRNRCVSDTTLTKQSNNNLKQTLHTNHPLTQSFSATTGRSQDSGIFVKSKPLQQTAFTRIRLSGFLSLRNSQGDSTDSCGEQNHSSSLPNLLKSKVMSWLSASFSKLSQDGGGGGCEEALSSHKQNLTPDKIKPEKSALQDLAYKKLMEKALQMDPYLMDPYRSMARQYKTKEGKSTGFDIREFPRSSTGGQPRNNKSKMQRNLSTSDPHDLMKRIEDLERNAKSFTRMSSPPRLIRQKSLEGTPICSRETSLDVGDDSVFVENHAQKASKNNNNNNVTTVSMETTTMAKQHQQSSSTTNSISPPPPNRPSRYPSSDRWQQRIRVRHLMQRTSTSSSTESEDGNFEYRLRRETRLVHKADSLPEVKNDFTNCKRIRSISDSDDSRKREGDMNFSRFYHVFKQYELNNLIEDKVKNLHIISTKYDHGNWCVVAEKVQIWTF